MISSLYNSAKDLTYIQIEKNGSIIYPSTVNTIQDVIKELDEGKQYKERIVEITTSGEYISAEDGTEVTTTPGSTKVYIFYTDDIT